MGLKAFKTAPLLGTQSRTEVGKVALSAPCWDGCAGTSSGSVGAAHKVTKGRTEAKANASARSPSQPRLRAYGLLLFPLLLSGDRCFPARPPTCAPQNKKYRGRRSVSICRVLHASLTWPGTFVGGLAGGFRTTLQEVAVGERQLLGFALNVLPRSLLLRHVARS